jgi:hypothetical protein
VLSGKKPKACLMQFRRIQLCLKHLGRVCLVLRCEPMVLLSSAGKESCKTWGFAPLGFIYSLFSSPNDFREGVVTFH